MVLLRACYIVCVFRQLANISTLTQELKARDASFQTLSRQQEELLRDVEHVSMVMDHLSLVHVVYVNMIVSIRRAGQPQANHLEGTVAGWLVFVWLISYIISIISLCVVLGC